MSEYTDDLISKLRLEAEELKDCFTRFAFQANTVTIAIIAFIAKFSSEDKYVGLAGIFIAIYTVSVMRIGIHKYHGANRLYAYQLHLEIVQRFDIYQQSGWGKHWSNIGWEEAMRAWRIIEPIVREKLYYGEKPKKLAKFPLLPSTIKKLKRRHKLRDNVKNSFTKKYIQQENFASKIPKINGFWRERWFKIKVFVAKWLDIPIGDERLELIRDEELLLKSLRWFEPNSIAANRDAKYQSESYLRRMSQILFLFAATGLLISGYSILNLILEYCEPLAKDEKRAPVILVIGFTTLWAAAVYSTTERYFAISAKRHILESGLSSIPSGAILWRAIITAHFRALHELNPDLDIETALDPDSKNSDKIVSYEGYTAAIVRQANDLCHHITSIYEWMNPQQASSIKA